MTVGVVLAGCSIAVLAVAVWGLVLSRGCEATHEAFGRCQLYGGHNGDHADRDGRLWRS